ncbi:HPF/RaiA family ribosome-associated protein [Polaromonas sp. SM01]|uniref:HPF/RaiA family ribosome-associated protein n=1 Tax=Polaromonas sp. SM01 TaxID=3085630 RepID=UPI002982AA96|nr:HPF/RaiA family ribosome-associated protein [Polaromonas sp. SM01]MDW5442657.1 HPF/RaiA family ribosome-associated protein [Polaromonas sp. SM01]
MQVQVNTNHSIEGREALERWAQTELSQALNRFNHEVTRVEVHLSDEVSGKNGTSDKRCLMEARLANHPPVAVTHHAGGMDEAFRGAEDKLKRVLDSTLGRQKDHRDRDSIRRDVTLDASQTLPNT